MRMTVADLMCEKPVTVKPEITIDEALDAFYEFETSELYVVDQSGRFLGILPDYELLRAELSGEAKGAHVEQFMSRSVPVVRGDTDAAEVARAFRDSQCGRLPVVKGNRLIGVVTRADVMRVMAVLRRIDAPVQEVAGPKRPGMFAQRSTPSRKSRAKSVTAKNSNRRSRSKAPSGKSGR